MHFGVCFFCVLLASESFVTAMPLPSFKNVLEQQIKDKDNKDFYTVPQIISQEGSMPDSVQNEGDYDTLYKSLHITNNAGNTPTSEYHGSSNKAGRDDSESFPSSFLESPKFKLNSLSKRSEERNVKKEDYSSGYINAFVRDGSTNNIAPMNKLREQNIPMESSSVTVPASEVKHVVRRTANLKNILSIMSPEKVKPVDDKLRKPNEEEQNILSDRKFEERQEGTPMDEVDSSFTQQGASQLNHQKKDEQHPTDEGEQDRGPLRRKQRNTGVFWRKRDIPFLGYDTSGMLGGPEDENLLQKDMYGLESSTQDSFVPNPNGISYVNGRDAYLDIGGINSPDVNDDKKYVPNLPLNSIQDNVAVQNNLPFQFSRPYNHNYQRFSSLTNSANDIPSNTYLTANSYHSEVMPDLPAEPSDSFPSSSDEDTVSFSNFLVDNDNIGFNSQEVLPHKGEIKYLSENHDKDSEKKYSYNDEMSNILNQNDLSIYPGLYKHNSYLGDSVVSGLSDSYPSEREQQFTYNNYRKTKNFPNNKSYRDYSSNRDIQEKYVEGENNIDTNMGYYSDSDVSNSAEQKYPYNYPGTLKEIPDSKNYQDISPQLLHNSDINEIETRDSDVFSPMNFMSQSKSEKSSPSFGHFTSYTRPAIMDSNLPINSQYDLQNNIKKNLLKRYKYPRKYVSVRRNSQVSPFIEDNEYAEFHPRHHRTQDSMIVYDDTDSDSDIPEIQTSTKTQRKLEKESQMSYTNVSDRPMAPKRHSTRNKAVPYSSVHSQKGTEVTFDPLKCLEEAEGTEAESTETTTLPPVTESTTEEEVKKTKEEKQDKTHEKKTNRTSEAAIQNSVPVCKTDFPCSVDGVWYSHTGGVLLSLQGSKDEKLNVRIFRAPSYYKGQGILNHCWNITGEVPFHPRMKSFISLKATEDNEHKMATFVGECFTCEGEDVIYGSWLLGRPARSCSDQHISTIEYKDVFKKSHLHGKNCKKMKRKHG